ncbi:MAG: response regulator transcription factor [Candidatus Omnitrophota bacterium]
MKDLTVLIVEDDIELHTLYGLYLRGESFKILPAYNGHDALRTLAECIPDVIILDMIMPDMDGAAFLKEMHGNPAWKNIPVIIASVNEKVPDHVMQLQNIYTVLRKPFSMDLLISNIREAATKTR